LLVPFWHDGSLATLIDASWNYPRIAMQELQRAPLERLAASAARIAILLAPLVIVAASQSVRRRAGLAESLLWGWLVAALGAIALQTFSWWAYQMTLLIPPCAMLGLIGAANVRAHTLPGRIGPNKVAVSVMLACVAIAAAAGMRKWDGVVSNLFASRPSADYEARLAPGYERLRALGNWHRSAFGVDASLCVLADPAIDYHAHSRCPATMHVWSEPAMNAEKWRQMATELRLGRPDLIYLGRSTAALLTTRTPQLMHWLRANYVVWRPGLGDDVWLRRQDFSPAID
jgi:hypothetical protein